MTGALAFLRAWHGDFLPQLTAITPDGPILQQRDRRSLEDAAKFVIAHDGVRNLYYSVNVVRADKIGKATKTDVTHALGLHVDLDYRVGEDLEVERVRILGRLKDFSSAPTCIVFSGGGFNALWKFTEPLPLAGKDDVETVEAANRALEYDLCGDHCHNIDRILRLPSSWNLPNRKKMARGRVKARAEVVEADWSKLYRLSAFRKEMARGVVPLKDAQGQPVPAVVIAPRLPGSFTDLGLADHVGLHELILRGPNNRFPSRSECVWHVVCELVRRGVPDDLIVGTLLHPRLAISASVLEKPNPSQYAARQVTRARLAQQNSEYRIDLEAEAAYERASL